MILIDTTFVNSSGGINILIEIIESIPSNSRKNFLIFIDKRLKYRIKGISSFEHYFTSNLINRQLKFKKNKKKIKVIFSLGNVPMILTGKRYQLTYNMQYFLFSQRHLTFNKTITWKIKSLVIWLFFKISNSDVAAQTRTIKSMFINQFNINKEKVLLFPIFKQIESKIKAINNNIIFCPSSGEKYKKIEFLIKAFKIHNKKFPESKLILTIDSKYKTLIDLIRKTNKKKEIITNKGLISHNEIIEIMKNGSIIVHPSIIESFGLVLLEASQLQSVIIAPKLPYVFDVCYPSYTYTYNNVEEFLECLNISQKDNLIKSKSILKSTSNKLISYLLSK